MCVNVHEYICIYIYICICSHMHTHFFKKRWKRSLVLKLECVHMLACMFWSFILCLNRAN